MSIKRVFQIINKKTGKYHKLMNGKSSWRVMPTYAIKCDLVFSHNLQESNKGFYIQEYVTVPGRKFDLFGNEIKENEKTG